MAVAGSTGSGSSHRQESGGSVFGSSSRRRSVVRLTSPLVAETSTSGATCWVFVSWLRPSHADAACVPGKRVTGLPGRGHWSPGTEHSWWVFSMVCWLGHPCLHPDREVVGVGPRPWVQQGLWLTCGEQDPCGHRDTEQMSHCPSQQLPQHCCPSVGEWGLEPQGPLAVTTALLGHRERLWYR